MPHTIDTLLEIMAALRDPQGGCPWDRKQDYRSIVPYTIEEAYEVADSIERGDMDELRGELGDLLFQVVFYAQLAREEGRFDFNDVVASICDKMIRRHPHVFADEAYESDEQLRAAWEARKAEEREQKNGRAEKSLMDGITRALPALVRAEKLQKRAARVGFDWPDAHGAFAKCREELDEIEAALTQNDSAQIEEELGDLLFSMVNVTRMLGVDAEQALRNAGNKFAARFRAMEQLLAAQGRGDLSALDLVTMDAAWEQVKSLENTEITE